MRLEQLSDIIENRSPLSLQEDWDNSGFQIKLENQEITKVLVALEISGDVIEEAVNKRAEAIVTHHPLFFHPLKKVIADDMAGKQLIQLVQKGISVYASHTPFDKCHNGNNDYLGQLLHLRQLQLMEEDLSGFCRCGYVDGDCTVLEYIDQVASWLKMDVRHFRFTGDLETKVEKVGLCTGAGAEFIGKAKEADCDLFVTGDVKYHEARLAQDLGLNILDLGHYGSEKIFVANMAAYLRENTEIEVLESQTDLNPFVIW